MPCDRDPVQLDPGNHDDPGTGGCLVEHVSVMATEPSRAWPGCTHPLIAAPAPLDSVLDEVLGETPTAPPAASPAHDAVRPGSSAALRAADREELCA